MKKITKKSINNWALGAFLVVSILFLSGCRIAEVREITINVHDADVRNPSCISYMEKAIKTLPGSDYIKVKALPEESAIIVTYDAMSVGRKNLEDALAQAGFDAGEYKANEKARSTLPMSLFLDKASGKVDNE